MCELSPFCTTEGMAFFLMRRRDVAKEDSDRQVRLPAISFEQLQQQLDNRDGFMQQKADERRVEPHPCHGCR